MSKIIQLREDDWSRFCPKCHRQGVMVHEDYKNHWNICKEHKLKWYTGHGIFFLPVHRRHD